MARNRTRHRFRGAPSLDGHLRALRAEAGRDRRRPRPAEPAAASPPSMRERAISTSFASLRKSAVAGLALALLNEADAGRPGSSSSTSTEQTPALALNAKIRLCHAGPERPLGACRRSDCGGRRATETQRGGRVEPRCGVAVAGSRLPPPAAGAGQPQDQQEDGRSNRQVDNEPRNAGRNERQIEEPGNRQAEEPTPTAESPTNPNPEPRTTLPAR